MTEKENSRRGIPINLFLSGRLCLVVGGGKTALQKIRLLLEANAKVTVVCSESCPEVAKLAQNEKIHLCLRPFDPVDVEGATLVYAATNNRAVNRQVLECCRKQNILCSCVDGNWSNSDFSTPSITRLGQLTVSVSSGGTDCRRAKMVNDSLARHLRMMESAHLVVVGTDHNHLCIEEREPFHLTGHRFEQAGFMIMQLWGIHEFMILNTCNRVEVVAIVSGETSRNGILRHILGFTRLKEDKFYLKTGQDGVEHLCLGTAGMLSQTPGENHVTAQIKDALETAKQRGWANGMIQEWVSSALHVSKEIKNQITPSLRNYEIEDLALGYLEAHNNDLATSTVMVLGAGTIGKGLVKDCFPKVGKIIWCYHVNQPELSNPWKGKVELCTFNAMRERLAEADIVISATESPGHLLHLAHAPFFNQERPVTLLDLGMPRNIDPALDDLSPDLSIVDLDGLKYWYRREFVAMDDLLARCRTLIAEHQNLYEKITSSFQSGDDSGAPEVNLLELRGKIEWEGDLAEMRKGRIFH
jgi:glutamyl-tRNA reductase